MMMGSEDHDPILSKESLVLKPSATESETFTDYGKNGHFDPLNSPPEERTQDFVHQETYKMSPAKSFRSTSVTKETPFVEPPSYADVVYTPYGGEGVNRNGSSTEFNNSSSSTMLPSSTSFSDYLTITVSQPQRVQETTNSSFIPGSGSYVTYLIYTQTNIPQYEGQEFTVRRRFRDVVTLADRLAESYRGYFVPARPDKGIVEGQIMHKEDFIEQRRTAIEKYLRRLANHPDIRSSEELRLFLQSQGRLPLIPTTDIASRMLDGAANLPRQIFGESSIVMTPDEVVQPAKGGRDLVRLFKELRQSVSIEWGGVKPAVNEDDKEFLENKVKMEDLQRCLSAASQQAEIFVKTQQDIGELMGELGLTFTKLAKFEQEEAVLNAQRIHAADVKRMATVAVKGSRLYQEANAQSLRHLDQLHEYFSLMQSVNTAFNDRSTALLTVQTLATEISSLNTRIERLMIASSRVFGGDKARNRRIEELKDALMTMEESKDSATREYERIKEVNTKELNRFHSLRQRDFLEMLNGFVRNQVGYAERIASVWHDVAEEFSPEGVIPKSIVVSTSKTDGC